MKKVSEILLAFLLFLSQFTQAENNQKFATFEKFVTTKNDTIYNCKIGYRTFGRVNEQKSNAILYPSWFGGTSEHLANLIGQEKLVDSTRYFVIAVDALGNGVSSSPSNYRSESGKPFPKITIEDMVISQYLLLTQKLNIRHLYAAIGGSMGSMKVFQWLVSYPDFIDKAIPYVCSPKLTSFDLLIFHTYLHIIDSGRLHGVPDTETMTTLRLVQELLARTPQYRIEKTSRKEFSSFFANFERNPSTLFGVDNWKAQTEAMISHDFTNNFGGSMDRAAAKIKADVFIIVSESDHLVNPQPALVLAKLIDAKVLLLKNNCGHLAIGCEMEKCVQAIQQFLE